MILLYIDPGTGSMLFAILIGLIGALSFLLKNMIIKVRFILSGGKRVETNVDKIPIVIFSDDKRYWSVFEPVCREFDKRAVDIVYMTASPDDPALKSTLPHIKSEFIGENNKAFAKLNFLRATILLATTPGLDVYQWKRSKTVDYYIHMLHTSNTVTGYRMFGIDYYDSILLSGEYQVKDVRGLEAARDIPAKELVKVGIPFMDEMVSRLEKDNMNASHERTVLLAPSWGESGIFQRYGGKIIDILMETGYQIIIRPHPQSFVSEKQLMEKLMKEYPNSEQLEWNRDVDNYEVLKHSDILISDFSGVMYDFALVYDKPIIYTETNFDNSPYDSSWLDTPIWSFTALPRIGEKLTADNLEGLKEMIDSCLENSKYEQGRREVRSETWEHVGEGSVRVVDYCMKKYEELTKSQEEK